MVYDYVEEDVVNVILKCLVKLKDIYKNEKKNNIDIVYFNV